MASRTHASLLARLRDPADQAAWVEFEGRYRALVVGYARRLGLSQWDAEDAAQAVFLRLVRALPGFAYDPARGRFRGWLGRLVRNAASDQFARAGAARNASDWEQRCVAESEGQLDAMWEEEWVQHHYRLALVGLEREFEPKSLAIFERLISGASVAETAAAFELSAAAVHKIKQRVRARLEERIARQLADEDEGLQRG